MKQTNKFALSGLLTAGIFCIGSLFYANAYTRFPEHPRKMSAQSQSALPIGKADPNMGASEASSVASFSDEPSELFASPLKIPVRRERADNAFDVIGNIFGVCNSFSNMSSSDSQSLSRCFWGKIDFDNYEAIPLFSGINFINTGDPEHQAGAVRDGILYIPEGQRSSVRDFQVVWKRFDIQTGQWLSPLVCSDNLDLWPVTMCYDPVSDSFFAMTALEESGITRYGRIVSIKLNETTGMPEATVIRDLPDTHSVLGGIFYYPGDNEVLALSDDHIIYMINRSNGNLTPYCELYCDDQVDEDDAFAGFDYVGSFNLVYSPRDQRIIWSIPSYGKSPQEAYLFAIDLEDGCVTRLGNLENGTQMVSLYTPDTFAMPDAADQVSISEFNLSENHLNGSATLKAPVTLYNGLELKENVEIIAQIDGEIVFRKSNVAPGAEETVNFTTSEGLHTFMTRADIATDNPGPETTLKFYAGNDTPLAPTNLKISENTISWAPSGSKGFNNGFINPAEVTYDVYFDGIKQNPAPISGSSFTFTTPSEMARVDITVTASFKGKTSKHSEPLNVILGDSLALPYSATPETAQADLFTIIDANRDGATFEYDYKEKKFLHQYETYEGSNDWLILPALYLDDPDKMYEFACSYQSFTPYYGTENISVWIGERPEVNAMRQLVAYPDMLVKENTSFPVSARFNITKPGKYYLAFHARTASAGAGSRVYNFRVNQLSASTRVPACPQNVKLEAAPLGANQGVISLNLPITDAAGKALNSSEQLTLNVSNLDQNAAHTATTSGKPGELVSVKCDGNLGFNSFFVSVSNAEGESAGTVVREYIGVDIPKIVTNLKGKTSKDNMTMELTWDRVTEGINGGYVDPENVEYQIWYNPTGVTWNRAGDPVKENHVIFDPNQEGLSRWRLSVFAQNEAGFKKAQTVDHTVEDILGRPNVLPIVEPFSAAGAAYGWNYDRRSPQTENSSIRTVQNDELNVLGIGQPKCDDGSGRLISSLFAGQSTEAELYVPKFSTVGVKNPTFEMRYWNYTGSPRFKVIARSFDNQEGVEIGEYKPDVTNNKAWTDFILALPEEFNNQEWIQLRIHFYVNANCYGVIDDINIYSNVEQDMKASSMSAEFTTQVGNTLPLTVTVTNAGREAATCPVTLEVLGDGKVIDSQSFTAQRIRPLRSYMRRTPLVAKVEYLQYEKIQLRLTTHLEGDEVPNNDSMTVDWEIAPSTLPIVSDLNYTIEDSKPHFTWSEPKTAYGSFDDFEYLTPFDYGEKLGQWTNFNNDDYEPYAIAGLTDQWIGWDKARAWQVVNDVRLGVAGDSRIGAHSGQQYLMAFSGWDRNNPDASVQVSKWLISPEVKGGQEVKFWVNTPEASYRETIHVMVSTTDDKPESFYKLVNRSKEGAEGWEQTSFTLPQNAKYFALVYVGWDSLGILIDDVQFEPANPRFWTIESYDVYRKYEGETQFTKIDTVRTPDYVDASYDGRNAQYYVVSFGSIDNVSTEGPASNIINVNPSGVSIVETLTGVNSAKGEIIFNGFAGKTAEIFSTDGKLAAKVTLKTDTQRVDISSGVYIVMIENKAVKVIVK